MLDFNMGHYDAEKPELEIGKEYRIATYVPEGVEIKGEYLGHVNNGPYLNKHVFVYELNNKKQYAFFSDHWILDIEGVVDYPSFCSEMVEVWTKSYFKERLMDKNNSHQWEHESGLLNILRELKVDI